MNTRISADKLIFLLYEGRSGSTFLARNIAQQLPVIIPPECNFILHVLLSTFPKWLPFYFHRKWMLRLIQKDHKFADWGIPPADIEAKLTKQDLKSRQAFILALISFYIEKMSVKQPGDFLFCIKKGSYKNHYQQLKTYFPAAKLILLIRDGRAIYNSQRQNVLSRTGVPFASSVEEFVSRWKSGLRIFRKILDAYPHSAILVRYEELLENTAEELRQLAYFLEVNSINNTGAKYKMVLPEKYHILHKNIDKPPLLSRTDKWQQELSPSEIERFHTLASDDLIKWGYVVR